MNKKEQTISNASPAVMLDLNDANALVFYALVFYALVFYALVFYALERESAKDNRDEQMIKYLIGIAKKLPVSNSAQLVKYC